MRRPPLVFLLVSAACGFTFSRHLSGGEVSGRAVVQLAGAADVAPAAGARVSVVGTSYAAAVGATGEFAFQNVPAGARRLLFQLSTKGDGVYDRELLLSLKVADVVGTPKNGLVLGDVLLRATGTVTGQVTLGGAPARGARVAAPGLPFAATTNAQGRFTLAGVPEGDYVLAAALGGAAVQGARVTALGAQTVTADPLALVAAGSVPFSGRALKTDGTGAGGVAVDISSEGGGGAVLSVVADPSGAFSGTLPGGLYRFNASGAGLAPVEAANVLVGAGSSAAPDLVLAPADACDGSGSGSGAAQLPPGCRCADPKHDTSGDGQCDALKKDRDGDGVPDALDDCPDVPNADQAESKKDGVGDACKIRVRCPDLVAVPGTPLTLTCVTRVDNAAKVTLSFAQTAGAPGMLDEQNGFTAPAAGDYAFAVNATQLADTDTATLVVHVTGAGAADGGADAGADAGSDAGPADDGGMDAGPADDGGMDAGSADAGDAGAPPPLPTIKGIFAATCASSATCACDSAGCWAKQGTQVYSAEVYGSTAFTATLSDPADPRIAAVEFLANGAMFATVSMSPLTGTLDTTTLDDGQITVSAQLVLAGGALADNRPLALALTLDNCDRDHDFAFKAGCGKFPVDCNDNDPAVGACSGGAPFCDATLLKCVCHPFNPQTFQSDTCQNASQGACDTFGGAPTCKPSCFQDTDCTGPGQFCDDQTFCRTYCPSDAACPSGRCVHATPPATTSPLTYAANHFKCEACAASDANACAAPTAATCAACVGATNACVSAACGCTGGGTPSDSCVALGQGVCASGACVACGADGTACAGGHGWACLSGQCVATGWSPLWAEPPARLGASVVFDSDKNRLVMFGGYSQAVYPSANPSYPYGDLWSLSLDVNDPAHGLWTRLVAQGTPPLARSRHVAVYDAPNKRMIVFGGLAGHNPGGDAEPQSDTWQLSFGGAVPTWTELNTGFLIPPKRELAAAALVTDTTPPQLIVIGGLTLDAFYSQHPSNDVWSLSLDANPRWTQLTPAGTPPSARFGAAAAYVPGRGVYLYGGSTMPSSAQSSAGSDALSDAYYLALGNLAWASLSPGGAQPGPRTQASAAYDVAGNRVLLFGGTDNAATPTLHSDVFALSPNLDQWTALSPANAASVPVALDWGAAFAPSTRTLYAYAGDAVWALDPAAGWSAAAQSPAWHSRPALLDDSAAGGRIYAAGTFSLSSNTYSSLDVWSFQHATGLWRQETAAGAPAANVISFLVPSTAQRKLFAMSAAGSDYSHLAVFDAAAGTWTSTVLSNPIGACQLPATQACTTPSDCDPTGTGKSTCITSVNGSFCAPCSYSNYPQVHDDAITFFDDANSRLVVSAGLNNGSTPYVQQWSIRYPWTSASQWTELVDAGAKLINPAYAYDSANKRLVVFGGADYATSNIASNDVWFVDLLNPAAPGSYGAWTKQTIAGRLPLPRKNASAVVMNSGKANAQLVVFGGYVVGTANGDGNDVWALSLPPAATLGWRQLCPGGALPQNRMFPSLTLVAAENALGLFGGWTGGSTLANYGKGGVFFNYDASFWELSPQTPFDDGTCPWRF